MGLLLLLAASRARPHVAPGVEDNNRYAKAILLPDRVRLVFTVFFGQRPGGALRRRLDANGNGQVDAAEARPFGERVAAQVASSLRADLDGKALKAWRLADVGLGTPDVSAGAFSVDLVQEAPYPDPQADEHTLWLEDRVLLDPAGETEIRIEESPGVRASEAHAGRDGRGILLVYLRSGNPTPETPGILARFTVDPALRPKRERPAIPWWAWAAGALVVLAAAAATTRRALRRRR